MVGFLQSANLLQREAEAAYGLVRVGPADQVGLAPPAKVVVRKGVGDHDLACCGVASRDLPLDVVMGVGGLTVLTLGEGRISGLASFLAPLVTEGFGLTDGRPPDR